MSLDDAAQKLKDQIRHAGWCAERNISPSPESKAELSEEMAILTCGIQLLCEECAEHCDSIKGPS